MTKHEFHIALVLIALIAAGVLGYDFLNSNRYSHNQAADCTLALYFSGPDGCQNSPAVRSIPGPVFVEKIESYFSLDEINRRNLSLDVEKPPTKNTTLEISETDEKETRRKNASPADSIETDKLK